MEFGPCVADLGPDLAGRIPSDFGQRLTQFEPGFGEISATSTTSDPTTERLGLRHNASVEVFFIVHLGKTLRNGVSSHLCGRASIPQAWRDEADLALPLPDLLDPKFRGLRTYP